MCGKGGTRKRKCRRLNKERKEITSVSGKLVIVYIIVMTGLLVVSVEVIIIKYSISATALCVHSMYFGTYISVIALINNPDLS